MDLLSIELARLRTTVTLVSGPLGLPCVGGPSGDSCALPDARLQPRGPSRSPTVRCVGPFVWGVPFWSELEGVRVEMLHSLA